MDGNSKPIVTGLVEKADRNISQVTDAVKGKRGTASRRIVRERIQELEEQAVLVSAPGSRGRTYRVSEVIVEKGSQVLGFPKYKDQPVQGQGTTRRKNVGRQGTETPNGD